MDQNERPISIAMLALGGQGGGVLTQWLVDIAEANGYLAQSTYVAGVAQRTGATDSRDPEGWHHGYIVSATSHVIDDILPNTNFHVHPIEAGRMRPE